MFSFVYGNEMILVLASSSSKPFINVLSLNDFLKRLSTLKVHNRAMSKFFQNYLHRDFHIQGNPFFLQIKSLARMVLHSLFYLSLAPLLC